MKAKLIEYAYPTSPLAKKAGMYKTGCWFVGIYESESSCKRLEILKPFFLTKEMVTKHAESLPNPYNWMNKYNNQ